MNLNLPELNTPDYPRRLRASLSDMTREIDRRLRMLEGGTWDGYHPVIGGYHLWIDATGDLRIKSTAPTSDLDGTVVGSQT